MGRRDDALRAGSKLNSTLGEDGVVFEISVDTQGGDVISILKKAGLTEAATDIDTRLSKAASKTLNELSKLALSAARSYVPIRSGYLRNFNISKTSGFFRPGTSTTHNSRQILISGDHLPPYRDSEVDSILLARLLDAGIGKNGSITYRSQDSHPESDLGYRGAGLPTAGWISDAKESFEDNKKVFLSVELADYFYQQKARYGR